ncbi:MAG: hypothetical protein ISP83_04300 [Candidatus Poseidonia sp.]|nr:hypothetical protein [Poseidonia sp.]MBL6806766.1 hypothetical protein [Poseidonia sp.]MBL6886234.1 hypothetical protein [Poseidonia sp.]MBL6893025.1 hypothetical protein [Poseidonia sp.]
MSQEDRSWGEDTRESEEEQNEEGHEHRHNRLFTALQVLAVITAMLLAIYNNALITSEEEKGIESQQMLVESEPLAPLAPCHEGGIRFNLGTDANMNGVLETNEVTSDTVLCHGLQGFSGPQGQPGINGDEALTQLLTSESLPLGHDSCPSGGTNITTGLDINANAELEEEEITNSTLLCNGVIGASGQNGTAGIEGSSGFSALVDKVPAPTYLCRNGFVIQFGVDDGQGMGVAANAVLEADEVRERLNFCFEPLRSERFTDLVSGYGNSMTSGCDQGLWLPHAERFVFSGNDGQVGCELFVSDGEVNTTNLLLDLHPNGDGLPGQYIGLNHLEGSQGDLIFFDGTNGVDGRALWVHSTSNNSTWSLGVVEWEEPTPWAEGLLFTRTDGQYVWTNGTALLPWHHHPMWNTSVRQQIAASISSLTQLGQAWIHADENALWFSARDAHDDVEAHRINAQGALTSWSVNPFGNLELTHLLSDGNNLLAIGVKGTAKQLLRLNDNGSSEWLSSIAPTMGDTKMGEGMGLHRIGNNLVYDAEVSANEARVWTTNLANGITLQLSPELLSPGAQVGVAQADNRLLFDCITPSGGTEVCVTDATPMGTKVLHELTPGPLSTTIEAIVSVENGWLFIADGMINGTDVGTSLWTVDGEAIRHVYNPWPGASNSSQALTYGTLVLGDTQAFFIAHDGITGHEWHRWSHGELSDDWIVIDR